MILLALLAGLAGPASFAAPAAVNGTAGLAAIAPTTSCIKCHNDPDAFEEDERKPVLLFREDVHAAAGLSCQDCHGGNPDLSVADDTDKSMDKKFAKGAYVGAPAREDIPAFCGKCHSNPDFMKHYKPEARVDEEKEYWTSKHGQLLKKGDRTVPTCIDCHGAHGILKVSDRRSPVYATKVAETCRGCHGDPKKMKGYTLADGRPIPTDQYVKWRSSVHAAAMFEKEDLTAPTCNDCHGNHGATPPGVESVVFVCGNCHGREADIFRASGKHHSFEPKEKGGTGGQCTTCHGNHGVVRPTIAMLAPLPETPCAFCHEGPGSLAEDRPTVIRHYTGVRDGLLADAKAKGLAGEALFDSLVDQAEVLPFHTGQAGAKREEFAALFRKFRIGKTHVTWADPATGEKTTIDVVRCVKCHTDAKDPGTVVAASYLDKMRAVTAESAIAHRTVLAARRGGVETKAALPLLDDAVNAQIELEVLVHGWSAAEKGDFSTKSTEGVEKARAALVIGREGLGELDYRRKGLAVALVFVLLVLAALALQIRRFPAPNA